jgi:uncharacterized protein YjfI (DUF2170 family)
MNWTSKGIHQALLDCNFYRDHSISAKFVEASLLLTFHEYGDLPVILVVGEKQILVEVALVERKEFEQPADIDYRLLNTHKYLPLSTIAIENINGDDWYVLFGALSRQSKLTVIVEELLELVGNTLSVIDALEPLYKFNAGERA